MGPRVVVAAFARKEAVVLSNIWSPRAPYASLPQPPDRLPSLSPGRHRRASDGACVMEYVSVLAGEKFSDRPRCTHPALALLARLVNDRIDDDAVRSRLALLAPGFIGTNTRDLRVVPTLTVACLWAAAKTGAPAADQLGRRLRRARSRLARIEHSRIARWRRRLCEVLVEPGLGGCSTKAALELGWRQIRRMPAAQRDRWLYELLADCVDETRRLLGVPYPAPELVRVSGARI